MKTFEIPAVPILGREAVRDLHSKAVLSTDREGLRAYKDKVIQMENIKATHDELNNLKTEMQDIKALLQQFVSKAT